jgi:hypothetical protein
MRIALPPRMIAGSLRFSPDRYRTCFADVITHDFYPF